jgi:hypothetical protein
MFRPQSGSDYKPKTSMRSWLLGNRYWVSFNLHQTDPVPRNQIACEPCYTRGLLVPALMLWCKGFTANALKPGCCCFLLLFLGSCGGNSSGPANPPPPAPSIKIIPNTALVPVGTNLQFSASVANLSDVAVNWTASAGTIDQSGFYTGPATVPDTGVATITVISASVPTLSASATVTISLQPVTLSISPAAATVKAGFSTTYEASVAGSSNTAVIWAVSDLPGDSTYPGTIFAGSYTATAPVLIADTFSVTATSSADPSKIASASVTAIPLENQEEQNFPIELGTSGINANTEQCCTGTLGSLVVDQNGQQYILSNNHVLGRVGHASVGEAIVQPGYVDTLCNFSVPRTVATFTAAPSINSNVDAAIAQVVPGAVDSAGGIIGLGGVNPDGSYITAPPASTVVTPAVGMAVAKSGRTTGLSCGTVTAINATILVDYPAECGNPSGGSVSFQGQVVVNNLGSPGDSGSLIVDAATAQPLALLSAGSGDYTTANPVSDVLSALDSVTGSTLAFVGGDQHTVSCSPSSNSGTGLSQRRLPEASSDSAPSLAQQEVRRAMAAQSSHENEIRQSPAVLGVAIGRRQDDATRAALLVFVERGRQQPSLPAEFDGVVVQIVLTGRFRAIYKPQEGRSPDCSHYSSNETH